MNAQQDLIGSIRQAISGTLIKPVRSYSIVDGCEVEFSRGRDPLNLNRDAITVKITAPKAVDLWKVKVAVPRGGKLRNPYKSESWSHSAVPEDVWIATIHDLPPDGLLAPFLLVDD